VPPARQRCLSHLRSSQSQLYAWSRASFFPFFTYGFTNYGAIVESGLSISPLSGLPWMYM
jgi:hypothetical protein